MVVINQGWIIRETALSRKYIANEFTGEFLDINDTTYNILQIIKQEKCSVDALIQKLSAIYHIDCQYITDDVNELLRKLNLFGVIAY